MIASFKSDTLLRVLGVRTDRACHYSQLSAQLLLAQARDARTPRREREAEGVTEFARTLPLLRPGLVREESTGRSQAAAVAAQRELVEVMSGIPPNCGPAQRNTSSLSLDHLTPANDFHSQRRKRKKKKKSLEAHSEPLND